MMMNFRVKTPLFFLFASLFFSALYALLIPPFQSPDEPNHFLRAYQVSEGHFVPQKTADQRLGGFLPSSLGLVAGQFAGLKNDYDARICLENIRLAASIPLLCGERRFFDFANTAMYAPTAYAPQAAAIALIRPFGASPLQMLYAGRLANAWVWCLLVFAAIRMLPAQRAIMAVLALLPASLVMAASLNADTVTNGLCFWVFAACLSAAPTARFPASTFRLPAFVIIAANKLIVIVFVLLQWLNGSRRYAGSIAVAAGLTALCWGALAQRWFIPYDTYNPAFRDTQTLNEGVDPAAQLAYMSGHPFQWATLSARSYLKAAPSIAAHIVGKFGWEKNYLPPVWIGLLWMAVLALVFAEQNPATSRQRLLGGSVACLYMLLFSATMYLLWHPVGAPLLSNLQGRYFVPVLPLFALAFGTAYLQRFRTWVLPLAGIIIFLGHLAMLFSIWNRYYG